MVPIYAVAGGGLGCREKYGGQSGTGREAGERSLVEWSGRVL